MGADSQQANQGWRETPLGQQRGASVAHSTIQMTQNTYVHSGNDNQKQAGNVLDDLYGVG